MTVEEFLSKYGSNIKEKERELIVHINNDCDYMKIINQITIYEPVGSHKHKSEFSFEYYTTFIKGSFSVEVWH